MAYTNINKPSNYFNTKLYTGNGATQSITGVGFQPDFTWIKHRNNPTLWNHSLHDSVRGSTKYFPSNNTDQEVTDSNSVTSFDSDGFSIGTFVKINDNGINHVAWNWKANGAGVSNTDGSISATVSASTTSGFSIVSYTGNSTAGATIGHGLGVKPSMIITKQRSGDVAEPVVYHTSTGATKFFKLNTTDAVITNSTLWNNTEPTSTLFTVGTASNSNASFPMIAYCFAEKKGFSKFGSYVGNGGDNFVYTGFKPAFVMLKGATAGLADAWYMFDKDRATMNGVAYRFGANSPNPESLYNYFNLHSNGFQIRQSESGGNGSGGTYIYMAFAEHPLVSSTGVPCTAR